MISLGSCRTSLVVREGQSHHSNQHFHQTNSPEIEVGKMKGCRKFCVTKGGLRGVCLLFHPFLEARTTPGKSRQPKKKAFFLRFSSDLLKPPSLKPPICGAKLTYTPNIRLNLSRSFRRKTWQLISADIQGPLPVNWLEAPIQKLEEFEVSNGKNFRKILVSVKFVSAILGPEMAAPILWTPGKNAFFLQEKPVSVKFLVLGGGGYFGFGGGECRFYFYGRGDFSGNCLHL